MSVGVIAHIAAYVDSNMEGMAEFLRLEREALARGRHADWRELVTRIVGGTAISTQEASRRLGYSLDHPRWSSSLEVCEASLLSAAKKVF